MTWNSKLSGFSSQRKTFFCFFHKHCIFSAAVQVASFFFLRRHFDFVFPFFFLRNSLKKSIWTKKNFIEFQKRNETKRNKNGRYYKRNEWVEEKKNCRWQQPYCSGNNRKKNEKKKRKRKIICTTENQICLLTSSDTLAFFILKYVKGRLLCGIL